MTRNRLAALLLASIVLLAGCTQQKGTLEGTVTIGPLCPVEPCKATDEQKAQAYAARKILVYDKDRMDVIKTLDLSNDGRYWTDLAPGIYVVDINRAGMDRSAEVPKQIEIEPGKTIILDIAIDTGIR